MSDSENGWDVCMHVPLYIIKPHADISNGYVHELFPMSWVRKVCHVVGTRTFIMRFGSERKDMGLTWGG